MHTFLDLNKVLRTDSNNVTQLLDNVPVNFSLINPGDEAFFSYPLNTDLLDDCTLQIHFDASNDVHLFVSDQFKKPNVENYTVCFDQSKMGQIQKFVPFKSSNHPKTPGSQSGKNG